ncbi:ABC transporter ATP-binding protein [Paenibacillus sp. GCM10027626]|uniref:ABC transporter ATP-binding protein n=1 Tax=Paenibacillus sp. GCM10027626 TaxID=3273411 RepID=UPI003645B9E3
MDTITEKSKLTLTGSLFVKKLKRVSGKGSIEMNSTKNNTTHLFIFSLFRSVVLISKSAPKEILISMAINAVFGSGPAVLLYLGKLVIDQTQDLSKFFNGNAMATLLLNNHLIWIVVAFIILNVILDSVETINGFVFSSLRDRLQGIIKAKVFHKISEFEDIALFESPKLLNILQLAQQSIPRITQLSNVITNLITGFFVFIPVLILSFSISWWIPIVIFVTAIPSVWVQLRYEEITWSVVQAQAALARKMGISERLLTGGEYAKEIRQFRLQSLLLRKWRDLFDTAFREMFQVRKKGTISVTFWSIVSGLGAGIPYLFVVLMAISGQFSIGDLAMYAGLVFQVRRSLFVLIGNTTDIQGVTKASIAIFELLDMKPSMKDLTYEEQEKISKKDANHTAGITISGVSFSYPGSNRDVLKDIYLSVDPGEMVVIVGENGAGKTTLTKLLCRLYDPNEGAIIWGGRDIRTLDINELRNKIAVVNQDFSRFPATVRENIGYGFLEFLENDREIMRAAEKVGIKAIIESLPKVLETPLSKELEDGVDLSGGQWQRMAIARALLRYEQAEILLLDEPTASLDPNTEHDVFQLFREMTEGKISFVVSHRLSLARHADKIVVMDGGKIVEIGSHEELMDKKELYYTMFTKQASSYADQ